MKRGLVIEGGGMRGAHSCGALMALVQAGIKDFDVIVATSAGACSVGFFVSRQFDLLPVVWTKYLHDGRFINLKKLPTSRSVMDLDYLIDDVFGRLEPLDVEAIRKSRTRFFMAATDCETGQPFFFNNREHPILKAMKASAALPIAYRHPVVVEGRAYVDGGVAAPIPIEKALEEGCNEITVLLTRPEGYRKKAPFVHIVPRYYQRKFPHLAETIARRHRIYNEAAEKIEKGLYPCRLRVIRPSVELPIRRLSTNLGKIWASIEQGYHDALFALSGGQSVDLVESLE